MHLRHDTATYNAPDNLPNSVTFYTDGSCDDPRDPYAARAAWAVVYKIPAEDVMRLQNIQLLATGHCVGHQTINRAKLQAMVAAAETADIAPAEYNFQFGTDSQFVNNTIDQNGTLKIEHCAHRKDHWDLTRIVRRLMAVWDPNRFMAFKIKPTNVSKMLLIFNSCGTSMEMPVQIKQRCIVAKQIYQNVSKCARMFDHTQRHRAIFILKYSDIYLTSRRVRKTVCPTKRQRFSCAIFEPRSRRTPRAIAPPYNTTTSENHP